MTIYIIRHGKAEPLSDKYSDDDLRPLTEDGRKELAKLAGVWKRMGIVFDKLISSPLLRAKQTAEVISKVYEWKGIITERDALGHKFSVNGVISMLEMFLGKRKIALVGHNPDLGKLAAAFLSDSDSACVDLKKSSIMGIDFLGAPLPGTGRLMYYFPPKYLRQFF